MQRFSNNHCTLIVSLLDVAEIISGCLDNNPKYQRALFDTFSGYVYAICTRYCSSPDKAQDSLQETFVKVFQNLDKWDSSKGSMNTWISRITVNTCINKIRSEKRFEQSEDISESEELLPTIEVADSEFNHEELLKLIEQLPLQYKTVFNMYAIEGYSHKEIAAALDITESTSRSSLTRARRQLQDLIKKHQLIE